MMSESKYLCKCGREFNNSQSFNAHKSHCKIHQLNKYGSLDHLYENNKKRGFGFPGCKPWNTGLTKEDYSENALLGIEKMRNSLKGKSTGKASTDEKEELRRKKISNTMKLKGQFGGMREGSGRGKKGKYKGYYCDSTYELVYVIFNLDHNIQFKRCDRKYPYSYKGEQHYYYPDFELSDGSLVEIKATRQR